MGFFDDLSKNIQSKSQVAGAAIKEKTDTIKIKNSINANNARINDVYKEIGEKFYAAHKTDEQLEFMYVELFEKIKGFEKENEELNNQLNEVKKIVKCPNCGKENDKEAAFCFSCGSQLPSKSEVVSE